jgi:hypothetical protein
MQLLVSGGIYCTKYRDQVVKIAVSPVFQTSKSIRTQYTSRQYSYQVGIQLACTVKLDGDDVVKEE